jgi:nitronate monooxygenase
MMRAMAVTFDTAFCRLVGVPLPIVQAPIGGLATPEVASAASEAGALGMLAMTWKAPEEIDAILGRMSELTDKPFGVNLILRTEQEERLASRRARLPAKGPGPAAGAP